MFNSKLSFLLFLTRIFVFSILVHYIISNFQGEIIYILLLIFLIINIKILEKARRIFKGYGVYSKLFEYIVKFIDANQKDKQSNISYLIVYSSRIDFWKNQFKFKVYPKSLYNACMSIVFLGSVFLLIAIFLERDSYLQFTFLALICTSLNVLLAWPMYFEKCWYINDMTFVEIVRIHFQETNIDIHALLMQAKKEVPEIFGLNKSDNENVIIS